MYTIRDLSSQGRSIIINEGGFMGLSLRTEDFCFINDLDEWAHWRVATDRGVVYNLYPASDYENPYRKAKSLVTLWAGNYKVEPFI